ncbi:HAMP domain-containing histidine kinase, partial [bacterium]|nr:HAMP domain-containing histidine kinase [bacterium]
RLEKLKEELFYEYEVVERQNRQLLHNNCRLEELLRERTKLSKSLEKRVNDRTMELEDTVTQLKELDEMKSYFLSITSHELRTPLTIINGALNLLLTDGDQLSPERYRKYMLMAKNNAEHLNKLISNLLDLSRLESGQLKLEVEKIDVVRLVRESLEEFREIAKKNNLQLFYEMSGEHPEFIGDSLRIKQIVDNLLSNAVKFTPSRGEIRLHLSMDEKQMEVRVSDNGLGIEDWEKEKIFKKFQQSERSLTRESAGVGLGLAIVRDLVKLHEGTIVVESEKGKGSTFIVRIPKFSSGKSENIVRKKSRDDHEPPKILGNK